MAHFPPCWSAPKTVRRAFATTVPITNSRHLFVSFTVSRISLKCPICILVFIWCLDTWSQQCFFTCTCRIWFCAYKNCVWYLVTGFLMLVWITWIWCLPLKLQFFCDWSLVCRQVGWQVLCIPNGCQDNAFTHWVQTPTHWKGFCWYGKLVMVRYEKGKPWMIKSLTVATTMHSQVLSTNSHTSGRVFQQPLKVLRTAAVVWLSIGPKWWW